MQAIRIPAFSSSMDNLVIEEVPKPAPASGEVLVKVLYAPVNPSDFNFIRGDYDSALSRVLWNRDRRPLAFDPARLNQHPEPPYTLGGEGVGIVEAAGGGLQTASSASTWPLPPGHPGAAGPSTRRSTPEKCLPCRRA